jgi:hypothetical protein
VARKAAQPHLTVAMALPRAVPAYVIGATNIVDRMTLAKATFPSPAPALAIVTTHIADLTSKESTAKTRASGAVEARNEALKIVHDDLKALRSYVEVIVNGDPTHADTIAADAGMALRKSAVVHKPDLVAKRATVSGAVDVVAKAISGAKAYDWQYSADGGKTWTSSPSSTKARTQIANLQVGATVSFRHRAITKGGPQDWGQPVSTVVV